MPGIANRDKDAIRERAAKRRETERAAGQIR
jgi:hypothetical protein